MTTQPGADAPALSTPATLELPVGDPALADVLRLGRARDAGGTLKYARPVQLLEAGPGPRRVRFELVDEAALGRPSSAAVWFRAARAVSLTATFTPCLAVLLYGLAARMPVSFPLAITSVLGALALQLSVNLWNDAEDHARLIDMPGTLGGAGVIQRGWLSARAVQRAAVGCLVLGLALGVPALLRAPGPLLGIGLLALLGTMGYSGKPFGFKYRALGDLTVLLLCGPGLTAGFGYAAFGRVDASVLALGGYFGLAAVAILHANNWQDADLDQKSGAATVASLLGPRASRVYLVMLYLGALGAWSAGYFLARTTMGARLHLAALLGPVLALPPVLGLLRDVLRAKDPRAPGLEMVRVRAAQVHLMMGVALCIGLGVALAAG